jgi:hypothetical protein
VGLKINSVSCVFGLDAVAQRVNVPSKYASIENKLVIVKGGDKTSTHCTRESP